MEDGRENFGHKGTILLFDLIGVLIEEGIQLISIHLFDPFSYCCCFLFDRFLVGDFFVAFVDWMIFVIHLRILSHSD